MRPSKTRPGHGPQPTRAPARLRGLLVGLTILALAGTACTADDIESAEPAPTEAATPQDAPDPSEPSEPSEPSAADGNDREADDPSSEPAEPDSEAAMNTDRGHAEALASLSALVPDGTRYVLGADLDSLMGTSDRTDALLNGDRTAPLLELLAVVGRLSAAVDLDRSLSVLIFQTGDDPANPGLLATTTATTVDQLSTGPAPTLERTHAPTGQPVHLAADGTSLALLPGGILVAGTSNAIDAVLDRIDPAGPPDADIAPFLVALDPATALSFAYSLPALGGSTSGPPRTLTAAHAVTGGFDLDNEALTGTIAFHTPFADEFVETFNALNRAAAVGPDAPDVPLTVDEPVVGDLGQVVVTLRSLPLAGDVSDQETSLHLVKKLVVGMNAFAYAEGVADRTKPAWLDFIVRSEADAMTPPSPGSVYIRWRFRDQAAIDAFEQNELPAGFRLAPTRFVESDAPEGEYFFALNVYNAAGGSIVGGARAEWDVFVHPPEGADPNAGERPRFMVVDVLAEEVSADSVNLLTTGEPLSHAIVGSNVVSTGARFDADGNPQPVFSVTFPIPDPATADVARFTREMAIGNDYIYWGHGVSDRVLYNATTFNHDAYFVDVDQLVFGDDTRWSQYLAPEPFDAVYYVNDLEYVASPMANLDSTYLDITPEWLETLVAFTTNGHQDGLMRSAVEQLFLGTGDPFVGFTVTNQTPTAEFHFPIEDPLALEELLDLPSGRRLAPISVLDGDEPAHHLTLSVFEVDGALGGTQARWTVYTDDGSGRPPHMTVIETLTEHAAFDPTHFVALPDEIRHELDGATLSISLRSPTIDVSSTMGITNSTERALSLDWIEAGDRVCATNGICDLRYYDAETLDVPVAVLADIEVSVFETPWNEFVASSPSIVFIRDNAQEFAMKPWYTLDVPVAPLPFSGLGDATHRIEGTGTLSGRSNSLVDSEYSYLGDARLDDRQLSFAIDQTITNTLGTAHIFTTGSFDLETASGTQTVIDCIGDALICSDIDNGSSALFVAQRLDAANPDRITWEISAAVDLGPNFGTADSLSSFTAVRATG